MKSLWRFGSSLLTIAFAVRWDWEHVRKATRTGELYFGSIRGMLNVQIWLPNCEHRPIRMYRRTFGKRLFKTDLACSLTCGLFYYSFDYFDWLLLIQNMKPFLYLLPLYSTAICTFIFILWAFMWTSCKAPVFSCPSQTKLNVSKWSLLFYVYFLLSPFGIKTNQINAYLLVVVVDDLSSWTEQLNLQMGRGLKGGLCCQHQHPEICLTSPGYGSLSFYFVLHAHCLLWHSWGSAIFTWINGCHMGLERLDHLTWVIQWQTSFVPVPEMRAMCTWT